MTAAYRPGPDTGVTVSEDGGTVYVAQLPGGPLLVLAGAASVIWFEATTAPGDGWVSRVADAFGQPEDVIAADVETFVGDLRGRGLLVPADAPSGPDRDDH